MRFRAAPRVKKRGTVDTSKQNKSQELIQSCDYCRWVKKEECYKNKRKMEVEAGPG